MCTIAQGIEKQLEDMNAPVEINIDADFFIKKVSQRTPKKYKCTCCGASFDKQAGNFPRSASPLYQSNDGFVTICNSCRDTYYSHLVNLYSGNEDMLYNICVGYLM